MSTQPSRELRANEIPIDIAVGEALAWDGAWRNDPMYRVAFLSTRRGIREVRVARAERATRTVVGILLAATVPAACSSGSGEGASHDTSSVTTRLAVSSSMVSSPATTSTTVVSTSTVTPSTTTTSVAPPRAVPVELAGSLLSGDVAFLGPIYTIQVGNVSIAYRQFGSGRDLVLVAGQASGMRLWPATLLRRLAAEPEPKCNGCFVTFQTISSFGDNPARVTVSSRVLSCENQESSGQVVKRARPPIF